MPLNIQFTHKNNTQPTPLNTIDEELCALLNVPTDPSAYVEFWLDFIGQQVCVEGYELGTQALKDKVLSWDNSRLMVIHDYLVDNYSSKSWWSSH